MIFFNQQTFANGKNIHAERDFFSSFDFLKPDKITMDIFKWFFVLKMAQGGMGAGLLFLRWLFGIIVLIPIYLFIVVCFQIPLAIFLSIWRMQKKSNILREIVCLIVIYLFLQLFVLPIFFFGIYDPYTMAVEVLGIHPKILYMLTPVAY